jgi:hypothetical protein
MNLKFIEYSISELHENLLGNVQIFFALSSWLPHLLSSIVDGAQTGIIVAQTKTQTK